MHDDSNTRGDAEAGTGRKVGRGLFAIVLALLLFVAVVGAFLVGPLGFVVILAVGFVLWAAWSAFGLSGPGSA
jgi:hypothetical protein